MEEPWNCIPAARPGRGAPATRARAQAVVRAHGQAILRDCPVSGVGVGRVEGGDPARSFVIAIYARSREDVPRRELSVEGVRTRFTPGGRFQPQ